jgi:RNA polymerase sigma-70 factor (ECF subfamily)
MDADRETDLMRRVKAGDRAAFEDLFRAFERPLGSYLLRLTWNRSLVEDLLQDTFLRVWKAAPGWEPAAKVSTWIFRIAHHLHLNAAARRQERSGTLPERAAPEAPGAEAAEALRELLAGLPEGERAVLLLSEVQGFRYAEIADVLGIPVGTVKSRMSSAVRRLRELRSGRFPGTPPGSARNS